MSAVTTAIRRSAIGLGLFAIITGGTIALTQGLTKDRIQEQAARAEARALFEIIPESQHDNDLLKDVVALPASERLPVEGPVRAWVARKDGRPIGMILPTVAPDGYSGNIRLLAWIFKAGYWGFGSPAIRKHRGLAIVSKPASLTGSMGLTGSLSVTLPPTPGT